MWAGARGVAIVLLLTTPGAVLTELQQWTPVILTASGMAGTALALAGAAYQKSRTNSARMADLELKIPKRSTDATPGPGQTGVSALPAATGHAAIVDSSTATWRGEGSTR